MEPQARVLKRAKAATQLITERGYLPALLELLNGARKRIDVMAFSFAIGSAAGKLDEKGAPFQIARTLAEIKRKRDVDIRLYIEGVRETYDRNRVTAKFLKDAGVKVKYGSTHAKGFCVDGRKVLFGSTNLTNQSILRNNETNLLLDSAPLAKGFLEYFEHLWAGGGHGGIELDPPWLADGAFEPALMEMIGEAQKRIDLSIYFFSLRSVERALAQAHARGVKITGFINQHKTFALPYVRRTQATVRRLRQAGLGNLHFDQGHMFTHSKYLIRDLQEVALGTGNWLLEDVEIHPQLYIRLKDPPLARRLAAHLAEQIVTQASD